MARVVAVIPARMGSSRFPGKPLAPMLGRSMLEHVFRRTSACPLVDETIVATCDDEIRAAAEGFGASVAMTSSKHERASDRIAEAVASKSAEIVVMVQGDEPMIHPEMIDAAVAPMLEDSNLQCVNLTAPIRTLDELQDPNTIKVVVDIHGDALFFSRQPIPVLHDRAFEPDRWFKQVCVIPFRKPALEKFAQLAPTPLEIAESVDMLRFLEHGTPVRMIRTDRDTHAVDTPEDLRLVEAKLAEDPYTATYLETA